MNNEKQIPTASSPLNFSKSEMARFGLTYTDTIPGSYSTLEQYVPAFLPCEKCGEKWNVPIIKKPIPLHAGYWLCKNSCNAPADETHQTI